MISVIIPLYNKEAIIGQSLQSVLSQDYDDFEVIVVNDGSTDRSADIVRSVTDPRVRIIEQENGGPSKARNTGVRNAKGEWIVFLDADDELLPGALSNFATLAVTHKEANFIVCPFYVNDGNIKALYWQCRNGFVKNPFKAHFLGLFLPHTGTCIYTKELVESCMFDENIRRYEDFEALFRMYRSATIYLDSRPVMVFNASYVSASKKRIDISEDFLGYLDFNGKCFWERLSLYKLFIEEREYYMEQVKELYPHLFYRYDLFLIYKIFSNLKKSKYLWNLYLRLSGLSLFKHE